MNQSLTVEIDIESKSKPSPTPEPTRKPRVPRVSRIMALAIRLDQLVKEGLVADYADIARLGHVSRVRVTHIMSLLHLAPDIQEELLFLPEVLDGHDPIRERMLRSMTATVDWRKQRKMWEEMKAG